MVTVRRAYADKFVFGTTKITEKSIVEPGQTLPMNKLIKGVINGSIVINPRFMEYDYKEGVSEDFAPGKTLSETMRRANFASEDFLDKQSDVPADPTASPSFDAVDAENLANSLASAQGAIEGAGGQPAAESVAPQVASPTNSSAVPSGVTLLSDGAGANS